MKKVKIRTGNFYVHIEIAIICTRVRCVVNPGL